MVKVNKPTKEEIKEYYINKLYTVKECCNFFGISKNKFYSLLNEYDIVRSKDDKSKVYSKAQNSLELKEKIKDIKKERYGDSKKFVQIISDHTFKIKDKSYTIEWLVDEYCNKNKTLDEMCQILQVSTTIFYQICNHYNIYKTNEQRYDNIKKTNKEKYGVISTLQLNDVREKAKRTCLDKFGVDNCMKSEIIKEKFKNSIIKKYRAENYVQHSIKNVDVWSSEEKLKSFLLSLHYEDDIVNYLREQCNINNIITNDKNILDGQEIDIYLPDYNIGIEFNGDYWHSDIFHNDHNGRSIYHQEKSLLAESKGIFLFQIFEYEWNNITIRENILNRLNTLLCKNNIKIPARKCKIIELTKEQKKRLS